MALVARSIAHRMAAVVMLKLGLWRRSAPPILMQAQVAECGIKCLHMVAAYYGHHADGHSSRLSESGTSLADLMREAQSLGLVSRALRAEPEELQRVLCPAILHWDLQHFVVLVAINGARAVVHDPARGRLEIDMATVAQHFTGVLLELQPGPNFTPQQAAPKLRLRELVGKPRGLVGSLVRIGALSLLVQTILLASPLYMQWVVDEALMSGDSSLLTLLALAFGFLVALQVGVQYLRDWLVVSIGNVLALRMSSNVAEHLLALPLRWFTDRQTGDIFSRFRSLGPITSFLARGVPVVLVDGSMALLTLLMLAFYHWQLALLVAASSGLYTLVRVFSFARYRGQILDQVETAARQESQFLETLRGIHSIKAFGQEHNRFERWQVFFGDELNAGIGLARFQLNYAALHGLLFGLELILVTYVGALAVLQSHLTLGMLFAFISYRGHFARHVSAFIEQWLEFRSLGVNLERLSEICLHEREVSLGRDADAPSACHFDGWRGNFSCHGLSVGIGNSSKALLHGVQLEVNAGECIVIIGASGVGKSSLLQVLTGLQRPLEGELHVGGRPLLPENLRAYRQQLGVVQQQDKLFSGSLLDNVTLFAQPSSQAQERALELLVLVGLRDLLASLPMGLATPLRELGSGLSAGEKQRLLLARALYRQPKLLLLDEATANLDPGSVAVVRRLLVELPMTKVVVTHDLSLVPGADRVFELAGQRLVDVTSKLASRSQSGPTATAG